MAEESQPLQPVRGNLKPVVISSERMNSMIDLFSKEEGGPAPYIAQTLVDRIAINYPDSLTYKGLRDGTAPFLDLMEQYKGVAPKDRQFSDDQIINLFAVDENNKPLTFNKFSAALEAAKREATPALLSPAGAVIGAKTGYKIQQAIPVPANPYLAGLAIGAKAAIPTITTLAGALGFYKAGEEVTDIAFGPEQPVTPGARFAWEMGKTAPNVVTWMSMPFMLGRNIDFGAAQYLKNLGVEQGGPKFIRAVRALENFLGSTGKEARKNVGATLKLESAAGAVVTGMSGVAEYVDPGDEFTKLALETAGGLGTPVLAVKLANAIPAIKTKLLDAYRNFKDTGNRQAKAVKKIIDLLENEGEDVDAVIQALASDEYTDIFKDQAGNPIQLTAGLKANSPALLGLEKTLAEYSSEKLGKSKKKVVDDATDSLKKMIMALIATGDKSALQEAAALAEQAFNTGHASSLQNASVRVVNAFRSVQGENPEKNRDLSLALFEVAQLELKKARTIEKSLYQAIPENTIEIGEGEVPNFIKAWKNDLPKTKEAKERVEGFLSPITAFVKRKRKEFGLTTSDGVDVGDEITPPDVTKFITNLKKAQGSPEREEFFRYLVREKLIDEGDISELSAIQGIEPTEENIFRLGEMEKRYAPDKSDTRFLAPKTLRNTNKAVQLIRQKRLALIAEKNALEEAAQAPSAVETGPVTLSSTELTDMYSLALELGNKMALEKQPNMSRIAYSFADSLLEDLNAIEEGTNSAYDIARAYSRSLNDVFTRAFAGSILEKNKVRGQKLPPELLAERSLLGKGDATFLRVSQIDDIGKFAVENNLPEAENTVNTITGVVEMIRRNAATKIFDKDTGRVDPKKLKTYIEENEDIINAFPALKDDLSNAQTANALLTETEESIKNKEDILKAQVSFRNLLFPDPNNPRIGAESPTTAVALALAKGNKFPMRSLNNFMKVINDVDDPTLKEKAASGLKYSILEFAFEEAAGNSRTFSPRTMFDRIFAKVPRADSDISLNEWMLKNNVIKESQSNALRKYLLEMARIEGMDAAGRVGDIVETAGPMVEFALRSFGSNVGAMIAGGQNLIARSAGSKYMQQLFNNMPQTMKIDVMTELMENPKLLATMMSKPRNDKEKLQIAKVLEKQFIDLGFAPARRAAPQVVKELEDIIFEPSEEISVEKGDPALRDLLTRSPASKEIKTEEPKLVAPKTVSTTPVTNLGQVSPTLNPVPNTASANVPLRKRFAALFPEDRALIEGIGSLRG